METYPAIRQNALPKSTSDHCPFLLDSNSDRRGSSPFWFELMWLEEIQFSSPVKTCWKKMKVHGWAGFQLVTKLKKLKFIIKEWMGANWGDVEASEEF